MFKQGLFVLLITAFAIADIPVTGQVFSSSGNPLAYAVIADKTGQNWVIADENGYFNYHFSALLKQGDELSVSRYGYQSGSLMISDKFFYIIELQPQPIKQESIIVSGGDRVFHKQITNNYRNNFGDNPHNTLQQIPGISIRSYGGKAGIMTLSFNGNPTVNTKIILGNVDLTSSQNGETDLSQIPVIFINQITVANSPGIFYGSGAVDGVLILNPRQENTSISASLGSYGYSTVKGNYSNNWKRFSLNLLAGYLSNEGNYIYTVEDSQSTRGNNDFERKYVALNSTVRLSNISNISAMAMESHQERGVAGSISWPTGLARRNDKLQLGNISYNHLNKSGYTKVQLSYRKSIENYNDTNPFWPISSKHTVFGNSLKIHHNQIVWKNITANFLYDGKLEKIESTDVGDHKRFTQSLATEISIPLFNHIRFISAFRIDKIVDSDIHPTSDLRIAYKGLKNMEFEYNIGTGFRNPTFNDLYWQPGGNIDLKPENSWNQSIKYKLYFKNNYSNNIYLNISDKHTDDLIQWVPIDETFFVWQPQNIACSRRTNITVGSQLTFAKLPMQIAWHTTYQKTNDIDLNKPLLYAPEVIGFINISYNFHAINVGVQAHYTGKRLAEYGFSDDISLPGYWYTSAILQYKTKLFGNLLSFIVDATNLLDKQYMSINGYPEPGRILNLSIKYILTD